MKILIVGPAWVGDMVMAQVLFKILVKHHSHLELVVVSPQATAALATRMPEVARIEILPVGHRQLGLAQRYRLAKRLREDAFDQAIVLPNSFKSALLPLWAKIPRRTGWLGEQRYGLLNDRRGLDKGVYPLMIERFAALGLEANVPLPKPLPLPQLTVDSDVQFKLLENLGLQSGRPILVLCPGAEYGPAKRWPVAYFAKVAEWYIARGGQAWIMGSPNELGVAESLVAEVSEAERPHLFNLCGQTRLVEAVDLMALASVVVSNDSGLMHVAAALQRPVVAVFGSTSPEFTPPLAEPDRIQVVAQDMSCRPCFERTCPLGHMNCLLELMPDQVVAAIEHLDRRRLS